GPGGGGGLPKGRWARAWRRPVPGRAAAAAGRAAPDPRICPIPGTVLPKGKGRARHLTIQDTLDNLHDFVDVLRIQPAAEAARPLGQPRRKPPRRERPRPG